MLTHTYTNTQTCKYTHIQTNTHTNRNKTTHTHNCEKNGKSDKKWKMLSVQAGGLASSDIEILGQWSYDL